MHLRKKIKIKYTEFTIMHKKQVFFINTVNFKKEKNMLKDEIEPGRKNITDPVVKPTEYMM